VLFDLRGKRRRMVQVTYLLLALLMGGGLVLFGIGGSVSGGLLNAFNGGGGSSGNDAIEERIDKQEERLKSTPQNTTVLQELVREYYQLATAQQAQGAVQFSADSRDELRKAASYWQRYVNVEKENPSPDTALFALRIYDVGALNQPKEAQKAASLVAESQNDPTSYLQLAAYAQLAKDQRTADLAAQKAVDLAPKDQKKDVRQQAEQQAKSIKQQLKAQQPSG
jgi:hypothetical protein